MNIPKISARAEVILDEIRLDFRELLRAFIGADNTQHLRDTIAELLTSYLYGFQEIQSAIVLCDEINNNQIQIEDGQLYADAMFVIDDTSFRAACSVIPTINGYNPDINVDISIRRQTVNKAPERSVFYIDIGNATFNLEAFQNAFQTLEVKTLPEDKCIDVEDEMTKILAMDFSKQYKEDCQMLSEDLEYLDRVELELEDVHATSDNLIQLTLSFDYNIAQPMFQDQVDKVFEAAQQTMKYDEMPSALANSLKV